MKKNILFILTLVTTLSACKKDAKIEPETHPLLITKSIEVGDSNILLNAEYIPSIHNENLILEYGFLWKEESSLKKSMFVVPNEEDFVKLQNPMPFVGENYSNNLETMSQGNYKEYSIISYIKTDTKIIWGNTVTYVGHRIIYPKIASINPQFTFHNSQVNIIGEFFDNIGDNIQIYLNNYSSVLNNIPKIEKLCTYEKINSELIVLNIPDNIPADYYNVKITSDKYELISKIQIRIKYIRNP